MLQSSVAVWQSMVAVLQSIRKLFSPSCSPRPGPTLWKVAKRFIEISILTAKRAHSSVTVLQSRVAVLQSSFTVLQSSVAVF